MKPIHSLLSFLTLSGLVLLTGCRSYNAKVAGVLATYESGNFEGAAQTITSKDFKKHLDGKTDGLLFRLEAGKMLQDAGRYEESSAMFERAASLAQKFDYEAKVSVTGEITTVVTDATFRNYRGTEYDRILLEVYQSLNYLARNDLSEALVHLRKAYVRQAEAVSRNASEIDRNRELASSKGVSSEQVFEDPGYVHLQESLNTLATPGYADYVNPLANFLSAVLLREDGDTTNALVDLRKCAGMMPRTSYLPRLIQEFEDSESPAEGRVYVVLESGMAPARDEFRLTLFTFQQGVSTFAIPTLVPTPNPVRGLSLRTPDGIQEFRTESVASVDSIVATDFKARLPGIVIRTIISTVAKEVATHQIDNASKNDLGLVLASLWKVATSNADLRTWRTLGSEFQIAYGEIPENGLLELSLLDRSGGRHLYTTVEIPRARTVFLYVRSPGLTVLSPHVFPIGRIEMREPPIATEPLPDA